MSDTAASVAAPEPPAEGPGQSPVRDDSHAVLLAEAFRVSPSFLAFMRGPEHVMEMANDAYHRLVGDRDILGRRVRDALPEVVEQGFIALLDGVFQTGTPFIGKEVAVRITREAGAPPVDVFVDFVYQRTTNAAGEPTGILVHGHDVTEYVLARREVERLLAESRETQEALEEANGLLEEQQAEIEITNQQLQENAVELEAQAEELEVTALDLSEQVEQAERSTRRARLVGEVGMAITGGGTLPEIMQRCCESAVTHLDAAFARIWILDPGDQVLVLTASAGMYTHLDGPHGRVPVGQFKIGQIAAERLPHLTNTVLGDPRVPEQEWARREGLVAFAGYPLVVRDETVGVLAMFSRRELTPEDFEAFGSAATAISVTISGARHLEGEVAARRMAEEANRAKAEFLSTMSHELRTPLNAIGGYTELLELGIRGPVTAEQQADLARIRQSQQHLLGLISDILDLAKDDAGALQVERTAIRVGDSIDAALALVGPLAAAKGLALSDASRECADVLYLGDEDRVRQVLVNLLGNAVKFTPQGGRISVGCALVESPPAQASLAAGVPYLSVSVTDTGVGIPADQMGRIFEPFTQIEREKSAYTRRAGGTGLGLTISRRLARLMGGDLTFESQEGEGSTFVLWLPGQARA